MISSDPYLSQKFQYRPNMTLAAVTLALLTAMRLNLNFQVLAGVNISFEIRTFQNTFRGGKVLFSKEKNFSQGKVLFQGKVEGKSTFLFKMKLFPEKKLFHGKVQLFHREKNFYQSR